MQKSNKKFFFLIILFISISIVIPNLLISVQSIIKIPIEEKNSNEIINPISPRESSVYYVNMTGGVFGVYVSGDYAYVACGTSLAVVNISDPTNPGSPVYEDTTGYATSVCVRGDYAFVTVYNSGLAIINISDPTNPEILVYEGITGRVVDVYVSGDYAFIADYDSGLVVINISNPINPGTPVYEPTTGSACDIYVSGDYAYVADFASGLAIINVSDPTNPETLLYKDTTGYATGVYVSDDYAYLADGSPGLAVIDISDPTNPGPLVYEDTTGYALDVHVSGDYAYVADNHSSLAIINITDPTNPGTPIYESTTASANDVYVSGEYAYVASSFGLAIIDVPNEVDLEDPIISNASSDFTVEVGYTGQSLSWTATDANPGVYTIALQGTGIVAGPTVWTSGNAINYNIPDGFDVGSYIYTVNFTDDYDYFITDSVNFTVKEDTTNPVIISTPSDIIVEFEYTGQSLSWTATDPHPNTYTIELQGSGIVAGPIGWTSGVAITYDIPDDFSVGDYIYVINFTDDYGNSITDNVTFKVSDTTNPIIISNPSDIIVEFGYTGQNVSWTATDPHPNTYTIELQGPGIVAGPIAWTSGIAITYNIPDGFAVGDYVYLINFTDEFGNSITGNVTFTVEAAPEGIVPFGNSFLIFIGFSVISLIFIKKRKIAQKSN